MYARPLVSHVEYNAASSIKIRKKRDGKITDREADARRRQRNNNSYNNKAVIIFSFNFLTPSIFITRGENNDNNKGN